MSLRSKKEEGLIITLPVLTVSELKEPVVQKVSPTRTNPTQPPDYKTALVLCPV